MLFVIVMEGLTILLEYAGINDKIKGMGRKGSSVNHILFASDVMLFSKVNVHYVKTI